MLIDYIPGEECRIAIVEDGKLEEFYQERASAESHVGNIYKGKVMNVEPSIQAAFVDFGLERNGFLHVSDLHPMYFPGKEREEFEQVGSKTPHRDRPPIQKCLKRGQEVLVQVLKEGIGTKGPTLTSYLSIPGRFLVMMPHMQRLGVSRKVEDDEQRREMRDILKGLNPPSDFGFIIRTAGMGQTKTDLKRDLAYLQRLWKTIDQRRKGKGKVGELYAESDLIIRTIRDVFSSDIDRIIVDDLTAAKRARDFLAIANPRARSKVVYYDDPVPMFDRFSIEEQIDHINAREVPLRSGGSLVIEQTEALVAIDVNSGKSRDAKDAESNAYNTNQEAVDEICRQLRLRDLGGVIVNDLIDMRQTKHRRSIEQQFRNNLKKDRARTRTGSISQFGILEMTRQRMRPSLKNSIYTNCSACHATGQVKSAESVVLEVMRKLALVMHHKEVAHIELTISPDVAFQLLNRKRSHLTHLEERYNKRVTVRVGGSSVDFMSITAVGERGSEIPSDTLTSGKGLSTIDKGLFKDLDDPSLKQALKAVAQSDQNQPAMNIDEEAETDEPGEAEGLRAEQGDGQKPKRRRRRRRGGRGRRQASSGEESSDQASADTSADTDAQSDGETEQAGEPETASQEKAGAKLSSESGRSSDSTEKSSQESSDEGGLRKRRRRRGGRGRGKKASDDSAQANTDGQENPPAPPAKSRGEISADSAPTPASSPSPAPAVKVSSGYSNKLINTGAKEQSS